MSAAPKKLSDPDRTLELVLPELTKSRMQKPDLGPASENLSESFVEKTRGSIRIPDSKPTIESLGLEMEKTSTSVKHTKTLPKADITNPLISMAELKSDELKKIALALFHETKKIIPMNLELKAEIANLKNEMIEIIDSFKGMDKEQNLNQTVYELNQLVKDCNSHLKIEYQTMVQDVHSLQNEKSALNSALFELQAQYDIRASSLKIMEEQKSENVKSIYQLNDEIHTKEQKVTDLDERHLQLKESLAIFPALQHEISDHKSQKEKLTLEISSLVHSARHLESKISLLEEQCHQRRAMLETLERNFMEAQKNLEVVRQNELELIKTSAHQKAMLSHYQAEALAIETMKTNQQKLQAEDAHFYHEKKEYFSKEIHQVEKKYKLRLMELEMELQKKKTEWEDDLRKEASYKEIELKSGLQVIRLAHMDEWRKKHTQLVEIICTAVKKSPDEQDLKNEVDQILNQFFGSQQKPWKL